ncbi:MAG: 30S ribosomal protein S3 [Candidatus Diapherotrites archaeon]|nr:30S ribosomal protein S3 [Candidatus Diapherotrites archaeon]
MIEREFVRDATTGLTIKEYLMEEVRQALPSDIQVLRTPLVTRIVLKVARPALVIGRKGHRIKQLTETLKKKFRLENPQIEVVPVQNSTLDAQVQAIRIAIALEHGQNWRRVMNRTLNRIMAAGAKGCEIVVKGKLGARGAKKRTERVLAGYMKKCGDPVKLVDQGHAIAKTKWATIGVHVYIVHPETTFPDHVSVPELSAEDLERIKQKISQPQAEAPAPAQPAEQEVKEDKPKKRTRKTSRKKSVKKEEVADGDSKGEGTKSDE